ncbi:unnamed protein product, partial [Brachionus calyciflorus]
MHETTGTRYGVVIISRNSINKPVNNELQLISNKDLDVDQHVVDVINQKLRKDIKRPQIWSFGLAQRKNLTKNENGKGYFEVVPNCDAQTLLKLIYDK